MSKRKREAVACAASQAKTETLPVWKKFTGAKQIGIATVVLLLVLGVVGAVSEKYKYSLIAGSETSTNNSAQPPVQTATPQLSKEYIYAGSRMLAVEDAAATSDLVPNSISGRIVYGNTPAEQPARFVRFVGLNATATGGNNLYSETNPTGQYQFGSLQQPLQVGANYIVTPIKSAGDINGAITPFDATLVLRHVAANGIGSNALNENQQIAANVDGDSTITAFDATVILRYVAANGQGNFAQTGNWKFTPATRSYPSFSGTFAGENYSAILGGDIDGDWMPTIGNSMYMQTQYTTNYLAISVAPPSHITAPQGSIVEIPVNITKYDNQYVAGYSFRFYFDPAVLQPASVPVSNTGTLSANCQLAHDTGYSGIVGVAAFNCGSWNGASSGTLINLRFTVVGVAETPEDEPPTNETQIDVLPGIFENGVGNNILTAGGNGYFGVEPSYQLAQSDSLPSKKSKDSSKTVSGSAEAFVAPPEQQQQQQQQQQTEEMRISLPVNAQTNQGSTLTIPVTLTNNNRKDLSAFNFDVQFNPAFLQLEGAASDVGGTLSRDCKVVEHLVDRGKVNIAGACAEDIKAAAGTLMKLRFRVIKQPNNASQLARALKFGLPPRFVDHHGKHIGVGRANGSIR